MADTLGLVVGIVLLGIQVCQRHVITYYNDYKDQDNDIDNLSTRLQRLTNTLVAIETSLDSTPQLRAQPSAQHVGASILSTCDGIIRLNVFLQKYSRSTSETRQPEKSVQPSPSSASKLLKGKLLKKMAKTAYPFRKGTVKSLKEVVTDLEANLNTTMNGLQM
jgi:hypothetical protein